MEQRALELLELPAILERLAGAAASEPGIALASELSPSSDHVEVARRQALTAEGIALYDVVGRARPRERRRRSRRGRRGGPRERARARRPAGDRPLDRGRALAARGALESADRRPGPLRAGGRHRSNARALSPTSSTVRSRTTARICGTPRRPTLRRLRRELRGGRARLAERLRALARDPGLREHLQDDFVTERGGPAGARPASVGARRRARHRPRQLRDGTDAVRRAARRHRGVEPTPRGGERRARGGRAHPARALTGRRRGRARARLAGRGGRADRSRARVRRALARLARHGGRRE